MQAAEDQWLVFSIPAQDGTRSSCCWKGNWDGKGEAGCSLESEHQSYGTRSDSPLAENVIVFSQIRAGKVRDMRVVGESCPVDAKGAQITWIGSVDNTAGLDWLEATARSGVDDSVSGSALMALALHRSPDAGQRLHSLAKETTGDLSEEAIFWLAEEYPQLAQGWLLEVIDTETDEDVLEQAVFAISQLPDGIGDEVLLELAKNNQVSRAVRRQAIFWLAQSDNDSSVAALTELLAR